MIALPAVSSRCFFARSLRVSNTYRVEAMVDLDFGVQVRRTFVFDDSTQWDGFGDEDRDRARHCAIVLMGGKKLIVQPDPRVRDRWHSMSHIPARVYLADRVYGRPIGFVEVLPEMGGPVLEVAPYLAWLSGQKFSVDLVLETVRG